MSAPHDSLSADEVELVMPGALDELYNWLYEWAIGLPDGYDQNAVLALRDELKLQLVDSLRSSELFTFHIEDNGHLIATAKGFDDVLIATFSWDGKNWYADEVPAAKPLIDLPTPDDE